MPGNVKATNRRFLPVVQREIRRLIRVAGPWQAGQLAGHAVSATLDVDVTLNPEQMPWKPGNRDNQYEMLVGFSVTLLSANH
jgi:hypothetical protein